MTNILYFHRLTESEVTSVSALIIVNTVLGFLRFRFLNNTNCMLQGGGCIIVLEMLSGALPEKKVGN